MRRSIINIIVGSFMALFCSIILIYAIENNKSFYQIGIGFVVFILPVTFFSSFFSKLGSFIFVFFSIMIAFFVSRYYYTDFWLGVVLALIIGGAFYIFITLPSIRTMDEYKPFSPNDYKEKAKHFHDSKK